MNILFLFLFAVCGVCMLVKAPDLFLAALLEGGGKAATTCLALLSSYAVWMGHIRIWEDCGFAKKVAKLVKPLAKKLLLTDDEECLEAVSMNLSVNLLGISGAATPYGVRAANLLDKTEHAEYSSAMFFVLNATSLQLLPTSLVAVRVALGSANPTDIIIPTLLTTVFSTLLGVALTMLFIKPKKVGGRYALKLTPNTGKIPKKSGAGM
jgi:spore maturation protein A